MSKPQTLLLSARRSALSVAAILLSVAGSSRATPVYGQANIAGTVSVSANAVTFNPTFISTGSGVSESGSFTNLNGGSLLSLPPGMRTGNVSQPGFIQFTSGLAAPVTFDLTYIAPGVGTVSDCTSGALGSHCTPQGSPFTLLQLTSNTVITTLQLDGMAYIGDPSTGYTPTVGIFSTTSAVEGSIPQIYQTLASGQSLNNISFSAAFDSGAPTPEPNVSLPLALALVGGGLLASHKSRRRT